MSFKGLGSTVVLFFFFNKTCSFIDFSLHVYSCASGKIMQKLHILITTMSTCGSNQYPLASAYIYIKNVNGAREQSEEDWLRLGKAGSQERGDRIRKAEERKNSSSRNTQLFWESCEACVYVCVYNCF